MNARKILLFLIYCIVLIPALPPVFTPLFEPYTFGKTELFEMAAELMLLVWIFSFWHNRKNLFAPLLQITDDSGGISNARAGFDAIKKNNLVKALFFMLGAFALSTFASADISASFWGSAARNDGLFTLAHFFLFFTVLASTLKKQEWLRIFRLSLFSSAFISLYALFQYFGFSFVRPSDGAIFGTLGNSAYLATYLLFHIFLAFFIAEKSPQKTVPLWYALAAFEIVVVLLTHNRAGMLGLACGLALFAGFSSYAKMKDRAVRKRFAAMTAALAFTVLVIAIPSVSYLARTDQTTQSRLFAWNAAAHAIAERPLIGRGANRFEQAYAAYARQAAIVTPTQESFDKPHNIILEILFSYGMLGLAAYAALWFVLLKTVWKTYAGPERFVWYGMFAAYGISLLFLFDTFSSLLLFFLCLAFFARAPDPPHGGTVRGFTSYERPAFHAPENIFFLQGGAVLLCFVLLFSMFHFKPLYSAYWARVFLVNAQTTGIADAHMKAEALRYNSFNSYFIHNAIIFAEQNLKK